jgi:Protein of unknown function (DUF2384)
MLDHPQEANGPDDPPPDEAADIREEAAKFFDNVDEWMTTENSNLAGRTPSQLIGAGNEEMVRDLLRRIKYIGVS